MLNSKGKAINPKPTLKCLRNFSKYDVDTRNQEDVSEFATILVNLIEESFDILFKLQSSQSKVKDVTASSLLDSTLGSIENELLASNNFNIKPPSDKTTLAIATANNLRKNRKNPIVNLLNGDILLNRKNSGKEKLFF
jgi:hypothetical protein